MFPYKELPFHWLRTEKYSMSPVTAYSLLHFIYVIFQFNLINKTMHHTLYVQVLHCLYELPLTTLSSNSLSALKILSSPPRHSNTAHTISRILILHTSTVYF